MRVPPPPHDTWRWVFLAAERGQVQASHGEQGASKAEHDPAFASTLDVARDFKISARTLRFYEERGLLQPKRQGSKRLYSARDRLYLKMILKGKALGFTLSEIAGILPSEGKRLEEMEIESILNSDQISAQIEHLEQQRQQITEAIKILRDAQLRLKRATDTSEQA
ncbi:MAG TPA: MerR family transcriptional regulator [Methylocella sp.]|nr:MerR family transcriptional regulator [Methylocella sp.]